MWLLQILLLIMVLAYFLLPPVSTVWMIVCLVRWCKARRLTKEEIEERYGDASRVGVKRVIVSVAVTAVAWACAIGIPVLLSQAITFM